MVERPPREERPNRTPRSIGSLVRKILLGIGAIAGGTLLALLLLEVLLRTLPGVFPTSVQQALQVGSVRVAVDSTIADDPDLVVRMRPNIDLLLEHPEHTWRLTTFLNYPGAGFRGNLTKRPVVGVAVGDSFTFGHGVDIEQTWTELLSEMIGKNIVNLGVGGYGPPQYTKVLAQYGMPMHPRLILYAIFQNDLEDSYCFTLSRDRDAYFACARQRRPSTWVERFLAERFSLYHVLVGIRLERRRPWRREMGEDKLFLPTRDVMNRENRDRLLRMWRYAQDPILEAKRLAGQHDAALIALLLPSKTQAYWHLLEREVPPDMEWRPDGINDLVRKFCEKHGIRYLDLTPVFQQQARQGKLLYFKFDAHWNVEGHRLAARTIYDYLVTHRLVEAVRQKASQRD